MHRFRRLLHGCHDSRMRSATADISLQGLRNFRGAGIGIFLQQGHTAYDHSGSAICALKCALIEKCLLHGMQLAVVFETFNGDDGFSRSVIHRKLARSPRHAIQQDGAGTALAFTATVLGSGQPKLFAQGKQQRGSGFGCKRSAFSVDLCVDWPCHLILESPRILSAWVYSAPVCSLVKAKTRAGGYGAMGEFPVTFAGTPLSKEQNTFVRCPKIDVPSARQEL